MFEIRISQPRRGVSFKISSWKLLSGYKSQYSYVPLINRKATSKLLDLGICPPFTNIELRYTDIIGVANNFQYCKLKFQIKNIDNVLYIIISR